MYIQILLVYVLQIGCSTIMSQRSVIMCNKQSSLGSGQCEKPLSCTEGRTINIISLESSYFTCHGTTCEECCQSDLAPNHNVLLRVQEKCNGSRSCQTDVLSNVGIANITFTCEATPTQYSPFPRVSPQSLSTGYIATIGCLSSVILILLVIISLVVIKFKRYKKQTDSTYDSKNEPSVPEESPPIFNVGSSVPDYTYILRTNSEDLSTHSEVLSTHSEDLSTHSEVLSTHSPPHLNDQDETYLTPRP